MPETRSESIENHQSRRESSRSSSVSRFMARNFSLHLQPVIQGTTRHSFHINFIGAMGRTNRGVVFCRLPASLPLRFHLLGLHRCKTFLRQRILWPRMLHSVLVLITLTTITVGT